MATRNNTNNTENPDVTPAAAPDVTPDTTTISAPAAPEKEKKVKIKIHRERRDQEDVFVGINERTWLIKRGIEVEVPACVAEALRSRELMLEVIHDFEERNADKD